MTQLQMVHPAYKIEGPALVSFSGGRTSAFMLHEILRAHDGVLPDDVHVVFANTGKEREETLRFVHECATRWAVPVRWVEWRDGPGDGNFEEVDFGSASRNGEPFEALMAKKQRVPNWQERWCTQYLKVIPAHRFMLKEADLYPGEFVEAIGYRDDEGLRILLGLEKAEKHGRRVVYPLARNKISKPDVLAFWQKQPFDLALKSYEGNCDLCFMKGRGLKKRIIRDNPGRAAWWIAQEEKLGRFDRRDTVAALLEEVEQSPEFDFIGGDEEFDTECGLICGAAA